MARHYVEDEEEHFQATYGRASPQFAEYKKATNDAFDGHQGYAFCYYLRNATQHGGDLPVSALHVGRHADGYELDLIAIKSTLTSSRYKASAKEIDMLARLPERISLLPHIDDAMKGLERIEDVAADVRLREVVQQSFWLTGALGFLANEQGNPGVFRVSSVDDFDCIPLPSADSIREMVRLSADPEAARASRRAARQPAPRPRMTTEVKESYRRAAPVLRTLLMRDGRDSLSWPHRDGLNWLHLDGASASLGRSDLAPPADTPGRL